MKVSYREGIAKFLGQPQPFVPHRVSPEIRLALALVPPAGMPTVNDTGGPGSGGNWGQAFTFATFRLGRAKGAGEVR